MRIKTGLGLFMAAALAHAAMRPRKAQAHHRLSVRGSSKSLRPISEPLVLPPVSSSAVAAGALALGALAIGALAIGALAIGRLEIKRARLRKVEIDDLIVRRFRVVDIKQVALGAGVMQGEHRRLDLAP